MSRPIVLIAALALLVGGCSDSQPATTAAAPPPATLTDPGPAAPELEALLPDRVGNVRLTKASTTGEEVFRGNAFGDEMSKFLATVGKEPGDLRFANAVDTSEAAKLELGVWEVPGVAPADLREAIVTASRPNAPGLEVSPGTLGGKQVTKVVYPGGSTLYLVDGAGVVFYVGSTDEALAAKALALLP